MKYFLQNAPMTLRTPLGILGIVIFLTGCALGLGRRAPVENAGEEAGKAATRTESVRPGYYHVKRGDTLYGIAWEWGVDYRDLASWNHIVPPAYKILEGQWLRLNSPSQPPVPPVQAAAPAAARLQDKSPPHPSGTPAKTAQKTTRTPPHSGTPVPEKSRAPASEAEPASKPAEEAKPVEPAPPPLAKPVRVAVAEPAHKVSPASAGGKLGWIWPTQGRITQGFTKGEKLRQGIDIAGQAGQPVVATENGKVVYSGSGLVGFGQIIIIKHDEEYLSAYAYNRKRLVEEGREVHKGERIAEMGQSSDGAPVLHFEIRRKGLPVDPVTYLPSR